MSRKQATQADLLTVSDLLSERAVELAHLMRGALLPRGDPREYANLRNVERDQGDGLPAHPLPVPPGTSIDVDVTGVRADATPRVEVSQLPGARGPLCGSALCKGQVGRDFERTNRVEVPRLTSTAHGGILLGGAQSAHNGCGAKLSAHRIKKHSAEHTKTGEVRELHLAELVRVKEHSDGEVWGAQNGPRTQLPAMSRCTRSKGVFQRRERITSKRSSTWICFTGSALAVAAGRVPPPAVGRDGFAIE